MIRPKRKPDNWPHCTNAIALYQRHNKPRRQPRPARPSSPGPAALAYSHSIVPGGLEVMS